LKANRNNFPKLKLKHTCNTKKDAPTKGFRFIETMLRCLSLFREILNYIIRRAAHWASATSSEGHQMPRQFSELLCYGWTKNTGFFARCIVSLLMQTNLVNVSIQLLHDF
jgi:hypothetical protein